MFCKLAQDTQFYVLPRNAGRFDTIYDDINDNFVRSLNCEIKEPEVKKSSNLFESFQDALLPATQKATQGQTGQSALQNFAKTLKLQKKRGGRKFYQAKNQS